MSFKGVLKHTIYVFIGAWMFLLGIMVGRGTVPVTFETRTFQERLQAIVQEMRKSENTKGREKKIALHYFEALNEPARLENEDMKSLAVQNIGKTAQTNIPNVQKPDVPNSTLQAENSQERIGAVSEQSDAIPVKTSKKNATFTKNVAKNDAVPENQISNAVPKTVIPEKSDPHRDVGAAYTIQVAAFKSFKDAVTQTAILDEKGFAATRTSKRIDGVTWYRVRVGGFATRDAALRYLEKLNQAGINGMIIKKENP